MWTFEYQIFDYFRDVYGFAPDSAWLVRARLGTFRLPNGTASFVSNQGLCSGEPSAVYAIGELAPAVTVARAGGTPLDSGFTARTQASSWQPPGLRLALEDVLGPPQPRTR